MRKHLPTLLIIDDDTDFCQLLTSLLDDKKLKAVSAHSLEQGTVFIGEHSPQIILLDNQLPDGKGIDFVKSILNTDPGIYIVMITGEGNTELMKAAFKLGVSHFIQKPCSFKSITDVVDSIL